MTEWYAYTIIIWAFILIAAVVFISLFFFAAPYGRHTKTGWGPMINNRAGWVLMEIPASLLFIFYAVIGQREINLTLAVFIMIWQIHYLHRAFIYPFTIRGSSKMPLSIALSGLLFNAVNTYVQGRWLFTFAPVSLYGISWLADPRFIIGTVVFITGYAINKHADYVLRNLRKPGEKEYRIPAGGLYRLISCPNYFGEVVEWTGWAILTWSMAGSVFALWTAANLVPRAYQHHLWYKKTFPDYPGSRKSVIPFVF